MKVSRTAFANKHYFSTPVWYTILVHYYKHEKQGEQDQANDQLNNRFLKQIVLDAVISSACYYSTEY